VPVRADRDRFFKLFFEQVPRPSFDDALQMSGDKRFYRLYDALHDDAYRNTSPGKLCRKFGISWLDLIELLRQYNLNLGLICMANHLPQICQDVARDARSREAVCPRCNGLKTVTDEAGGSIGCPMCEGAGNVRVPGDAHARKLMFEALGLIRR